eukprot:2206970-Amphidinium_carterae.2
MCWGAIVVPEVPPRLQPFCLNAQLSVATSRAHSSKQLQSLCKEDTANLEQCDTSMLLSNSTASILCTAHAVKR